MLAFSLYLVKNDNVLYFGIVLVLVSIIIYFINISSGLNQSPASELKDLKHLLSFLVIVKTCFFFL